MNCKIKHDEMNLKNLTILIGDINLILTQSLTLNIGANTAEPASPYSNAVIN